MSDPMRWPWAIVGAGKVGRMMGLWAGKHGFEVALTWNHSEGGWHRSTGQFPGARCLKMQDFDELKGLLGAAPHWVWLTVRDQVLGEIAARLSGWIHPQSVVCHMAGSLESQVLRDAGIKARCVSVHPLLAVAQEHAGLERMGQVAWSVEGEACELVAQVLGQGGIVPVRLHTGGRALYHAAAVTAAGLLTGVLDAAWRMLAGAGVGREQAEAMLLPLAHSCLENIRGHQPVQVLTGPLARGDEGTIARHTQALAALDPQLLELYELLTRYARGRLEPEGGGGAPRT